MQIHLVKSNYKLQGVALFESQITTVAENYEEQIAAECSDALKKALVCGKDKLAIDVSSFVKEDCNCSYITNVIIEVVAELYDTSNIPLNFGLYLVGATKDESKQVDLFKNNLLETVEENHLFGDPGDSLKPKFEEYQGMLKKGKEFRYLLTELIEKKGIVKDSDAYKAAGVSKSVFSRKTNKKPKIPSLPSRGTVAAFAIGLKLNLEEAKELYKSAGYYLGKTDIIDRTIRFFIDYGIYDIDEVNYCLAEYGAPPLGERSREDRLDFRMNR